MKSNSSSPLIKQLSVCGQIAERKAQMLREHDCEEASVLEALTAEQQNQLGTLLTILQNTGWSIMQRTIKSKQCCFRRKMSSCYRQTAG